MNEARTLKVDPHLIFDVIYKQSGTVSKAIAEGVMNSADAGASQCHVEISSNDFAISDDGKGFVSRNEIERFFETFGTPHVKGDAKFGRFRIGRGQMMAFGENRWRSGAFFMNVDLKSKGLDYVLRETPDDVSPGCSIEVRLYDRLSPSDIDGTMRELKELLAYFPIPVFLNGTRISKDRATIKWDHEDDQCLIAFRESGAIKLYNLGMYVRSFSPGQYGGNAAIVVSKEQVEVNFARTDVLVNQCSVWKHVRKVLDRHSATRGEKRQRVTNEDRQYAIRKFITGETSYRDFREQKVFPLFPSGFASLDHLATTCGYRDKPLVILSTNDNDRIAEAVVRAERARVLRSEVLDWCNADDAGSFVQMMADAAANPGNQPWESEHVLRIKVATLKSVSIGIADSHAIVHSKELTPLERCTVRGLEAASVAVRRALRNAENLYEFPRDRQIRVGQSDAALAWTDGRSFVAFDRQYLARSIKSLGGIGQLIGTLLHEFLHDEEDTGSHIHDGPFYQRFHDVILSTALAGQRDFLKAFYARSKALKAKIPAGLRKDLDAVFALSEAEAEPAEDLSEAA